MASPILIPNIASIKDYVGEPLGPSDWFAVTQEQIDDFARATDDYQWIHVDVERARGLVEGWLAMVTSLAPVIGYDRAAEIAKEAFKTGRTVREICQEQEVLPADELAAVLDPLSMTEPGSA